MSEPYENQLTICDPNACIICGQKHEKTFLKSRADVALNKNNRDSIIPLLIVISIIAAIAAVAVPIYRHRIRISSEASAIVKLQTIVEAELSFRHSHGRYGTFEDLIGFGELIQEWDIPIRGGYYFTIKASGDSVAISARPTNYAMNHRDSFISYIDIDGKNESSAIYGADNGGVEASRFDELIGKTPDK